MADEVVVDPSAPLNLRYLLHDDWSHSAVVRPTESNGSSVFYLDPSPPLRLRYVRHDDGSHTPIVAIDGGGGGDGPSAATVPAIIAGTGDDVYLSPLRTWEAQAPGVLAVSAGVATPDLSQKLHWTLMLTANTTLANPVNAKPGQCYQVYVDRAGSQTLSFGAAYRSYGGIELPATAGKGAVVTAVVTSLSPLVVRVGVAQEV